LGQAVTAPERTLIKYTARPFAIPFQSKHHGRLSLLLKRVLVTGIKNSYKKRKSNLSEKEQNGRC